MTERIIDNELRLIPYYRNDEASLPWYQDLDVCKQVDNREEPYDVELLHRMYDYLTAEQVKANIYSFNGQSQRMFQSVGFEKTAEEWYESKL